MSSSPQLGEKPVDYLPFRWMPEAFRRRRCLYCGAPARNGYTCPAHSDLPQRDPVFSAAADRPGDEAA
jgi:hypothetical protein